MVNAPNALPLNTRLVKRVLLVNLLVSNVLQPPSVPAASAGKY